MYRCPSGLRPKEDGSVPSLWVKGSLMRSAGFGCFHYFDKISGVDVVDVTVNRNVLCNEGMFTDTADVLNYA
jgi:hypothetical protein